ncbi:nuclear transport factor 2 family protein [Promicromonospora vindobonensis]|uniref:Nuclear transport factor 2 family protein n=1 Tax=Promicromonospora vindobonensis TaxID=195748 RepID=A0ABW5VZA7_9MICO
MTESTDVVRAYWQRMHARDWTGLRRLLAPDVVVEWTASNEQFVGPDAVVGVNREYPEGWSIRVRGVVADGDTVASDVEVPMDGVGVFRVAAFARVREGLLVSSVEYWIGVGDDEPPAWRARYSRPADDAPLPYPLG